MRLTPDGKQARASLGTFKAAAWARRALDTSMAVLMIPSVFGCSARLNVAHLGDFTLQSGEIVRDAFVGYRTLGRLNEAKSNAVLVLPWYSGTSQQLAEQIGPGKLVDSSRYFVIAVDTFGNGVSSSPSNSARQPGETFPRFEMADIVESQYQLVTRTFGLKHLHAVVGVSMGGMQVFQWMTAHPDFMDKGVSIVGSPQVQPDDLERLETTIRLLGSQAHDSIRQAQAIMALDIPRRFGGSMEAVASRMRADLMVVSTWQDREVNPKPAFDLARAAHAEVLELDGRCGHQAPSCERAVLWPAVARFLSR